MGKVKAKPGSSTAGTSGAAASKGTYAYLAWDLPTAARKVSEGLPTGSLEAVRSVLDLTKREFADVIHVSVRTLARRKSEEKLPPDESERVYRVGRLLEYAASVLGGEDAARSWMKESNYALGGVTPLEYVRTEPGAELVERLLGQIAHGVPS
ncbi:MAG: DUF2384 domain-containing protein [Rhodothermales bacterium]|nr:DUF2384 domain-containing protein [Rhodothermales bacterium]MBO6780860.1 DUF2384 domain-containing protein [Rhodothermales bacterium]